MSTYKLRPHHGLCLRFFRGEGYSAEFVENMTSIVATLEKNPTVQLVAGADAVCATCPNRVGDTECACDEKVQRYDSAVLVLCGLPPESELSWVELSQQIEKRILSQGLRKEICGDCQWNLLCGG